MYATARHKGMNKQTIPAASMTPLNLDDKNNRWHEPKTVPGVGVAGVAYVRVDMCYEMLYIAVAGNDAPRFECPFHTGINRHMDMFKTLTTTYSNIEDVLFYRCQIKVDDSNNPGGPQIDCGFNLYPMYPKPDLDNLIRNAPDAAAQPYVLELR